MRADCEKDMVKPLVAAVGGSAVSEFGKKSVKIRKIIKDLCKQLY